MVLVEDHDDVRSVITALLAYDPRFEVVGEATNGVEGIEAVRQHQPDLVLLDLAMPVMDGLTALPHILAAAPRTRVVALSAFGTDRTVNAAMDQGATAFVHKGAQLIDHLIPVLHHVIGGAPASP